MHHCVQKFCMISTMSVVSCLWVCALIFGCCLNFVSAKNVSPKKIMWSQNVLSTLWRNGNQCFSVQILDSIALVLKIIVIYNGKLDKPNYTLRQVFELNHLNKSKSQYSHTTTKHKPRHHDIMTYQCRQY